MPVPNRQEHRYMVAKWADIHAVLSPEERGVLGNFLGRIDEYRQAQDKPIRNFVVVSNKNNSLYEEVWGMVLAEVHNTRAASMRSARSSIQVQLDAFQSRYAQMLATQAASISGTVSVTGDTTLDRTESTIPNASDEDSADHEAHDEAEDTTFALEAEAPATRTNQVAFDFETDAPSFEGRTISNRNGQVRRVIHPRERGRQTLREAATTSINTGWMQWSQPSLAEIEESMTRAWGTDSGQRNIGGIAV